MRRWIGMVCCGLLLGAAPVARSSKEQSAYIKSGIERIIQQADPKAHIGIEIVSLKTGQVLYEQNGQHLFMPASALKIFTGAAALSKLGKGFRFETTLLYDGNLDGRLLDGNLYLRGSGDPELSLRDLEEMVFQLKLKGIEEIRGNLIIDNTAFDGICQGPGWMWDDVAEYWNAPLDGLNVNHNCVQVWVKPAKKVKEAPLVFFYPKTQYIQIDNRALTSDREETIKVQRRWLDRDNTIEITGSLPSSTEVSKYEVAVECPSMYAATLFTELLQSHHIAFRGKTLSAATPFQARTLVTHSSRPVPQMIEAMLKTSDNLIADALFKKMGEVRFGPPGNWQKGARAVREFLIKESNLDIHDLVLLDGCGLSRYNLVSPHQLVQFLTWLHGEHSLSSEFIASLPISGIDGSLSDRMDNLKSKVRAKPGTMTGVSSLAGYVTTKDNDLLAFTILINGFTKPASEYKAKLEDEVCTFLAK